MSPASTPTPTPDPVFPPSSPAGSSLRQHGLISMLQAGMESPKQRGVRPVAALMMLATWLGFVGISGAHLGNAWTESALGILSGRLLWGAAVAGLGVAVLVARRRSPGLASLAAMMAAYLLGNLLSRGLHLWWEPTRGIPGLHETASGFVASRLTYALGVAVPMLLVVLWMKSRSGPGRGESFHLGLGDWSVRTRLGQKDQATSWARRFVGFVLLVGIPFFFLMQFQVGWSSWNSGRLPGLALPLLFMALSNAFAEELLFRGFLQGAAVQALGPAWGIWMVGILFGLHHWNASFDVIASLPMALAVGVGSVFFGKATLETRGLAWATGAHAVINVGIFSAYYVAG